MLQKLVKLFKQLQGRFATKLPVGVTEFEAWADSFSKIYDLPTSDQDSIRHVLASMIINFPPGVMKAPKYYFYKTIVGSCVKQVAGSVFQNIQQAKFAAEKVAKRDAEAAALAKEIPNVISS